MADSELKTKICLRSVFLSFRWCLSIPCASSPMLVLRGSSSRQGSKRKRSRYSTSSEKTTSSTRKGRARVCPSFVGSVPNTDNPCWQEPRSPLVRSDPGTDSYGQGVLCDSGSLCPLMCHLREQSQSCKFCFTCTSLPNLIVQYCVKDVEDASSMYRWDLGLVHQEVCTLCAKYFGINH